MASSPRPALRLAINAFLAFHIVSLACWSLPVNTPLVLSVREFVRPYFLWAGLFQAWDMFSPSPKFVNSYVEAIVLYTDGNTRVWKFPRMEQLSFTARYSKERYRKFVEYLEDDKSAGLWPDAARSIARMNNNAAVPVKMVLLVRYWSKITPQNDSVPKPEQWDEDVFYSYRVQPGDLK